MHIENCHYGHKTSVQILKNLIQVLVFQMFRWMLPQRDLCIACEHGGVQMDALQWDLWMHMNTPLGSDGCPTEGLVNAHDQPWDHHSDGYQGRGTS